MKLIHYIPDYFVHRILYIGHRHVTKGGGGSDGKRGSGVSSDKVGYMSPIGLYCRKNDHWCVAPPPLYRSGPGPAVCAHIYIHNRM